MHLLPEASAPVRQRLGSALPFSLRFREFLQGAEQGGGGKSHASLIVVVWQAGELRSQRMGRSPHSVLSNVTLGHSIGSRRLFKKTKTHNSSIHQESLPPLSISLLDHSLGQKAPVNSSAW